MHNAARIWGSSRLPRTAGLAAAIGLWVGSVVGVVGVGGLAGCERPEPSPAASDPTTTVPGPEAPPRDAEPQGDAPAPEQEPASAAPWTVPERWVTVPGERPMRLATFEIPDESGPIEVAVTQFPGRVGGELANINRWRGQMGLPAAAEADLESLLERFEVPGYDAYIARIAGAEAHMLAVGVYEAAADRTWFVRATAPADAIDRVGPEVTAFARSIAGLAAEEGG